MGHNSDETSNEKSSIRKIERTFMKKENKKEELSDDA